MTRIFSISPYYSGQDKSHVYWFEESLKQAANSSGFEYFTFANQRSKNGQVLKGLSQTPLQRHKSTYFPFIQLGRDARSIIRQTKTGGHANIWHVYDGGFREFLLIALLLIRDKESKAVFNFTTLNPWLGMFDKSFLLSKISVHLLFKLSEFFQNRLRLFCDSIEISNVIDPSSSLIVGEYPMFSFMQTSQSEKPQKRNSILMAPCNLEEFTFCLQTIEEFEANEPSDKVWTVQMRWGGQLPDDVINRASKNNITIYTRVLSAREYSNLYLNASVVVLPYLNRKYYRYQSSGRLLDSVVSGAKVVVPSETVLARKSIENEWGLVFEGSDPSSMALAIRNCIRSDAMTPRRPITAKQSIEVLFQNWDLAPNKRLEIGKVLGSLLYFCLCPAIYRVSLLGKRVWQLLTRT